MKDFVESCWGIILGIVLIIIAVWGIASIVDNANKPERVQEQTFSEWVSPDGAHYWYKTGAYGTSWLAPRIDKDGNFVIDK